MPDVKVPGLLITSCPVGLSDLYLRENWSFLSPRSVHLSSSVLENTIIRNRNRTGYIILPCLAPTLKSMDFSIFTMMILNTLLLYICLVAEHSLGVAPYFLSIDMSSAWLDVSNSLTRSENTTHFGRFCLFLRCRSVFIVNVLS